ncbi:MAG: GGDEF domain-containing protein [Enterobacterales bacterium]|nr:GGDEF domain-containing protein [Enterobacterales bacterium]
MKLARRDALTGLRNRRVFDYKLEEFIGGAREEYSACLIVFDIDHFKKINDQFGHQVGDQLLKELGIAVNSRIRKSDRLYRIGGEEFAIILTRSTIEKAIKVAEDVRELVQRTQLVKERLVTISLGVASYQEQESKLNWFERCDNALYLAKREGRNQVKVALIPQASEQ